MCPAHSYFWQNKLIRSKDFRVKCRRILFVHILSEKSAIFLEFKCEDWPKDGHICTVCRGDPKDKGSKTKKGKRRIIRNEKKKLERSWNGKVKKINDILLPRKDFSHVVRSCNTFQHPLHYVNKLEVLTSGVIVNLTQKICNNIKARRKRAKEGNAVRSDT